MDVESFFKHAFSPSSLVNPYVFKGEVTESSFKGTDELPSKT